MDSQKSPLVHHPPPFLLSPSPTSPLQPQQTSPPAHNPPPLLRRPTPPSSPPPFLRRPPPPSSPPQPYQTSPPAHNPLPFLRRPTQPTSPPPFLRQPPPPSSPPKPHQTSPPVHNPSSFLLPTSPPPSPPQSYQKSPPVRHPPPFLLPPSTQPQPHQQEQPNSYIFPTNAIFQQPHQQNNLQLPFNSISGQNPKLNFVDHYDGSSLAAAGVEVGAKKKRGHPRKYLVGGNNGLGLSPTPIAQIPVNHVDSGVAAAGGSVNGAASSENPAKKGRGRPPCSGKKQKREASGVAGSGFMPHFIHVHTGEGRFNIISLSGSFLVSERNGYRSRTGSFNVTLCGPNGGVLGGVVDGILKAASPVQLVMGSFIPQKKKRMPEAPSSTSAPNMSNVGASADENGGNAAQPAYWGQAM